MHKTISIVIPCYNGERYLAEAIESALAQTHPALEVIVVDDGSKDRSAEIARAYGDRVRLISTENRGSSSARNTGAFAAQGDFVKYLDADDVMLSDALERQIAALAAAGASSKDILFSDWTAWYEDGRKIEHPITPAPVGISHPEYLLRNNIQTSLSLYPRVAFVETGGFDLAIKNTDEYEFNFRLALSGYRFRRVAGTIVLIRQHGGEDRIAVRYAPKRFPEGEMILAAQLRRSIAQSAGDEGMRYRLARIVDGKIIYAGADHLWSGRLGWAWRHLQWLYRSDSAWLWNPVRLAQLARMALARLNLKLRSKRRDG